MKQFLQLHIFHGDNKYAIRTQVWCTLIAQLLLSVLQQKANLQKAVNNCNNGSFTFGKHVRHE